MRKWQLQQSLPDKRYGSINTYILCHLKSILDHVDSIYIAKLKGLFTKFRALKTAASVKMVKIAAAATCPTLSLRNLLHLSS